MWWRCWRISTVFTRLRRLTAGGTARTSSPKPYGNGTRPSTPFAGPTSRQDPPCRTDTPNRSMTDSGMSTSHGVIQYGSRGPDPGWSLALGGQLTQAPLGPQGADAPGRSSTGSWSMITSIHSHKHWSNEGSHVVD